MTDFHQVLLSGASSCAFLRSSETFSSPEVSPGCSAPLLPWRWPFYSHHSQPGALFRRRGSTFDDFRRDRVLCVCLRRLPDNHALQAAGVNRCERIDRDLAGHAFALETVIGK
jgi:hypothetical protein